MQLLAVVTDPKSMERILRHLGEATEPPKRELSQGTALLEEPRAAP